MQTLDDFDFPVYCIDLIGRIRRITQLTALMRFRQTSIDVDDGMIQQTHIEYNVRNGDIR